MMRFLVVDNSAVIRKVARRMLEGMRFEIAEADDGQTALKACGEQMPDAILLDWNMPIMDGFEFLRHLRQLPNGGSRKCCSAPPSTTSRRSRAPCAPGPTNTS